ncbi:MAG: hypothetical protein V9E89_03815 [Ilumatobacteraceae bacterium]
MPYTGDALLIARLTSVVPSTCRAAKVVPATSAPGSSSRHRARRVHSQR